MTDANIPSARRSMPIPFPSTPFDLAQARINIGLVNSAYDMYRQWVAQGKPHQDDFKWSPVAPPGTSFQFSQPIWATDTVFWFFHETEPYAFVAWNEEGDVYLPIRGTESADDWIEDADADQRAYTLAPGYGNVHHGFNTVYTSMSKTVRAALEAVENPKRLFICGHSLGASLSTLAVPDVITNTSFQPTRLPVFHYNFASPRTGDPAFATAYNTNGVATWRVVNSCDLVPDVPPSALGHKIYEDVGVQVTYTAQYDSIGVNHSSVDSYAYALDHPDQPQGPLPSKT